MKRLTLFLETAYRTSPVGLWLATVLMFRGLWFLLPFTSFNGVAFTGMISLARLLGAGDNAESWWGIVHLAFGLLHLLGMGNKWVRVRLIGLGLGLAIWTFTGLLFFISDVTVAGVPFYICFALAYLWQIRQIGEGH